MILCNRCGGIINSLKVCEECGAPVGAAYTTGSVSIPFSTPKVQGVRLDPEKKGIGGKLWLALLLLAVVGGALWWGAVAIERSAAEQRQRALVQASGPLAVDDIVLQNTTYGGDSLGPPTTSFTRREIRYIAFRATLRNNAVGLEGVSGKLGVKYIDPADDVVGTDSSGFTFQLPLAVSTNEETQAVTSSWGGDSGGIFRRTGRWRIEFWFNGRKVGEAPFTVS